MRIPGPRFQVFKISSVPRSLHLNKPFPSPDSTLSITVYDVVLEGQLKNNGNCITLTAKDSVPTPEFSSGKLS